MQPKAMEASTPEKSAVSKASPPSKKARTADFSAVVKRSHSITENSLLDSIMGEKKIKEKVINDR